ncbi:uncharacterized protein LOC121368698 [Gigantopelta aegis]|uniref:uncharacterized protein LOC121368698 n=1 Tax=Gigantopelta aegis TaxID=1735272 RepID=UPI001B887FD3|nr:uncharacterized protein LOC121368698 [Gigantopelta aegis]
MACLLIACSFLQLFVFQVQGHGILLDPPGRSSLWREGHDVIPNYQDNELFCGGFQNQWEVHGGKCGLCGDPWQGSRDHEAGGKYATDIIARTYETGETIQVKVDITANHLGWFEFRLCPHNDWTSNFTADCLQLLELADPDRSGTRYTIDDSTGIYNILLKLPETLTCSQCVLQWKYHTANSWGFEPNGTGCMGCGAQEEFYGCADVAITAGGKPDTTVTPATTFSPVTTVTPATMSSPVTTVTPVTTSSPVTTVTPGTTSSPVTTVTPATTTSPVTTSETAGTTATVTNRTTTEEHTTTEGPESTTTSFDKCRATGPWEGKEKETEWCKLNCSLGHCPPDLCRCD